MDLHAKKKLLRAIPYGLYVAGVKAGEELHAFTLSWLTQVSLKPPVVAAGIRKGSKSLRMIRKGKVLSINFIRKDHSATIAHFFKPADFHGSRLGSHPFHAGETGAPILDEAVGFLECRVKKVISGFGDHSAVIAEVMQAKIIHDAECLKMSDTPWHYGG